MPVISVEPVSVLMTHSLCRFIISRSPQNAPVSDRAIPVAIFFAERVRKLIPEISLYLIFSF
jgi:hypothetical protein